MAETPLDKPAEIYRPFNRDETAGSEHLLKTSAVSGL
jgi:hypothetical protein